MNDRCVFEIFGWRICAHDLDQMIPLFARSLGAKEMVRRRQRRMFVQQIEVQMTVWLF